MYSGIIKETEMFTLPARTESGRETVEARAFHKGVTYKPTGGFLAYPESDFWQINDLCRQQAPWNEGYAYAFGPVLNEDASHSYTRVVTERGLREIWKSTKPVWKRQDGQLINMVERIAR
jgi:hypothetical protein